MEETGRSTLLLKTILVLLVIFMLDVAHANSSCPSQLLPSCVFSTPSDVRFNPIMTCFKVCDVECMHRDLEEYMKCAFGCMGRCRGRSTRKRINIWARLCAKLCMQGILDFNVVPEKFMKCSFRCMRDSRIMSEFRKRRWPWQLISSHIWCEFSLEFSSISVEKLRAHCTTRMSFSIAFFFSFPFGITHTDHHLQRCTYWEMLCLWQGITSSIELC